MLSALQASRWLCLWVAERWIQILRVRILPEVELRRTCVLHRLAERSGQQRAGRKQAARGLSSFQVVSLLYTGTAVRGTQG